MHGFLFPEGLRLPYVKGSVLNPSNCGLCWSLTRILRQEDRTAGQLVEVAPCKIKRLRGGWRLFWQLSEPIVAVRSCFGMRAQGLTFSQSGLATPHH